MLSHVFDKALYQFGSPVPSYWEATVTRDIYAPLEGDVACDVAVIGGGYTGLSAALTLAEAGISVRVLEAGHIGWGASGRNGGFVCFPSSKLGLKGLISTYGLEETQHFYRTQAEGVELVRSLILERGIDADLVDDNNYVVAHEPAFYPQLVEEAGLLTRTIGIATRVVTPEEFRATAHGGTEAHGAFRYGPSAAIHPLKFLIGLARLASGAGAHLHGKSEVLGWVKENGKHRLATAAGTVRARQVILATNGFTPDGLHAQFDRRVLPAISNIIVTRPLSDSELEAHGFRTFAALSNSRALLYYYRRLPDNRILFGGRGDTSGSEADGEKVKASLTAGLYRCFPEWRHVGVDYFWRGCVALAGNYVPSIGRLEDDPSVFYGFGFHGNGVANAPWAGRAVAQAIIAGGEPKVSAVQRGLPPRLPKPMWLRRMGLAAAYLLYGYKDRRASGRRL